MYIKYNDYVRAIPMTKLTIPRIKETGISLKFKSIAINFIYDNDKRLYKFFKYF